jgi:hypothetical protein
MDSLIMMKRVNPLIPVIATRAERGIKLRWNYLKSNPLQERGIISNGVSFEVSEIWEAGF